MGSREHGETSSADGRPWRRNPICRPVNLGDISTGRVKNVIDCLYPVIGGSAGAPLDDRVTRLEVWRSDAKVGGTIRVRVVNLQR